MAPERRCSAKNRDGSACRSPGNLVDPETGLCPSHAPGASERLSEHGRKGAKATAKKLQGSGLDPEDLPTLDGPQTAALWLERVGRAVYTGKLGSREGATVIRAVEAFLKAHEAGELSDEVEALRDALAEWKETGDPGAVLEVVK